MDACGCVLENRYISSKKGHQKSMVNYGEEKVDYFKILIKNFPFTYRCLRQKQKQKIWAFTEIKHYLLKLCFINQL